MKNYYETIIIGAGQAGLALAFYLKKAGTSFVMLDANQQLGESWRNRYDSLKLFTPRSHCSLPGYRFPGQQNGYPSKDEVADYLIEYGQTFAFPIVFNHPVVKVTKHNGMFCIVTKDNSNYFSKNAVIATGPFRSPVYPSFSQSISKSIFQIHSEYYRRPAQLKKGTVLIVGGGNSGMQIAAELSVDRRVYVSISRKPKYLPYEIGNRSIFWWLQKTGILKATANSRIGKFLRKNDPIIGTETKHLIRTGKISLLPRTMGYAKNEFYFANTKRLAPDNIIWATGYYNTYSWIEIPGVLDVNGRPIHTRGVSKVTGLYFLGKSWLHTRASALLMGAGEDAAYLSSKLIN